LKQELTVRDLERWKAHFRYRRELNEEEWAPVAHRIKHIDEVREQINQTAERLEHWGEHGKRR
jgi:hypothetical protein